MENSARWGDHMPDPIGHRSGGILTEDPGASLPFVHRTKTWPTGRGGRDGPQNQRDIAVDTNHLLECLDPSDLYRLKPCLGTAKFSGGEILSEFGQQPERIWFPVTCVVSLVVAMGAGKDVTVGLIGREGATGVCFGRQVVLLPGSARFLSIDAKQAAPDAIPDLRQLLLRHADALHGQVMQLAACNALHPVEARLARFLLSIQDRAGPRAPLRLTQEHLADALGVQRCTVNARAAAFQQMGLITYRRGAIEVRRRAGLEAVACECYGVVRRLQTEEQWNENYQD
jgi:CRP-like cAMP-binding protein